MITHVVLKVASRCNLNCSYCYLYNHEDRSILAQPREISDRVFDALLDRMEAHARRHRHRMALTLHGGEPTLIGSERMRALVWRARERMHDRLSGISLQTNATLLDRSWAALLADLDISVGVSMDGPADVHDTVRVTHSGDGSHAATLRGIDALQAEGIPLRILCVVNPGRDGLAAYRHFRALGSEWIDFLLPDVSHDNRNARYGTDPHPVADYLLPIFDAWLAENDPNVFIPLFWDLVARSLGSRRLHSDCFGNPPMTYVVVNTDGSIEPLDALKVCDNGLTRTGFNVLQHGFDELSETPSLLADAIEGRFELPDTCRSCRYGTVCAGGYLPHRYRRNRGFDNPSVWCTDIQLILDHIAEVVAMDGVEVAHI